MPEKAVGRVENIVAKSDPARILDESTGPLLLAFFRIQRKSILYEKEVESFGGAKEVGRCFEIR